ncbi:MAG: efflux RND transporter periplasmic adaptor subunit [Acidobacteria bacterium]|nr:efflux RND transporter periplasmic adaptor subunit [Acidobacteriota bacterium]MBI3264969.1 efflux RND transporter periplasmic adaptor subunit [Acidobacteriota bacterium]
MTSVPTDSSAVRPELVEGRGSDVRASTGHVPSDVRPSTGSGRTESKGGASGGAWKLAGVAVLSLLAGVGATTFVTRTWFASTMGAPSATVGRHEGQGASARPTDAQIHTTPPGTDQPGVYVSPLRQQLIGIRTAEIAHRALESTVKAVGTLTYDETRVAEIHTKIAGWVEQIHVDFVGKPVSKGEALFCVYSPELLSTQKEYLLALKARDQLARSQFAETREGADSLLAATRERLKLWDVSDAQIEELERTGKASKTLTLYSPFNGVVLERNTFDGHYLTPESPAFKIADLSTIWAVAQVFEYELSRIHVGQTAGVEFPYAPRARSLTGQVTFISPDIDPQTRRARVRVEFRNPGLSFKPGAYVTVSIKSDIHHELAVAAEAVIDNGDRQYVILARGNGYFEPREIEIGQQVGGYFPVLKGLERGDVVVTSAQFLIDSETNLKAAMESMIGHQHKH